MSILATGFLVAIIFFLALVMDVGDYFVYKNSVKTKEEMIEKFLENQNEYEKVVMDAKEILKLHEDEMLLLRGREQYAAHHIESKVFKDYPISMIAMKEEEEGVKVSFEFKFCPRPYVYWGIYYMESDVPDTWGEGKLEYKNGIFVQEETGSCKYETEQICPHWYYYQCWVR